jgi:hypothetical protein
MTDSTGRTNILICPHLAGEIREMLVFILPRWLRERVCRANTPFGRCYETTKSTSHSLQAKVTPEAQMSIHRLWGWIKASRIIDQKKQCSDAADQHFHHMPIVWGFFISFCTVTSQTLGHISTHTHTLSSRSRDHGSGGGGNHQPL